MVVRWKNKDGTGGVLTRPYTPEERAWIKHRGTVDHGGPYVTVGPRSAPPAKASTNRQSQPAKPRP
jgi:hypothetical protein